MSERRANTVPFLMQEADFAKMAIAYCDLMATRIAQVEQVPYIITCRHQSSRRVWHKKIQEAIYQGKVDEAEAHKAKLRMRLLMTSLYPISCNMEERGPCLCANPML